MRLIVCTIRDMVAGVYNNPYCAVSRGHAIRGFQDEVNRAAEDNLLYRHCDDYELLQLGVFETDTGVLSVLERPESLLMGRDAKTVVSPSLKAVN